jgi:HD superfamily phosphohydrolase YqeK
MTNIDLIKDALKKYDHVGVRGLSGKDATKKYRVGQLLKKSYKSDEWGSRKELLHGTSAVGIPYHYDNQDDKILEAILLAKEYSDCGKVILVAGDYGTPGQDNYEKVISTTICLKRRGATFLAYLK